MSVVICVEEAHQNWAFRLKQRLETDSLLIETSIRPNYPIAHAMVRYVLHLDGNFDRAIVFISNSENAKHWLFKELQVQQHYHRSFIIILLPGVEGEVDGLTPCFKLCDEDESFDDIASKITDLLAV